MLATEWTFVLVKGIFRFMKVAAPALLPLLRSQAQGELLSLLFLHPEDEFSLTDIARITGSSLTTVHAEASRMVKAGLVQDRRVGNIRLVSADTSTPLAPALMALLMATYGPPTVIGEELATVPGIELAFLYGAWAERHAGQEGPVPETLELLVVGTAPDDVLSSAVTRASEVLLRPIETRQITPAEWSAAAGATSDIPWLAEAASGSLAPIDLTPREPSRSRTPRSTGPREDLPAATPPQAPGDGQPTQTRQDATPQMVTGTASTTAAATAPPGTTRSHRPLCPLLAHVPVIGPRLPQWELPNLPAPDVPGVVTHVAGAVVDVASLKWLPWQVLPIHVHLGPCHPDSSGH